MSAERSRGTLAFADLQNSLFLHPSEGPGSLAIQEKLEELEDMNELPKITAITDEITTILKALTKQREEQRLFQFLNGLDEKYGPQRSQLLLMSPLPSVEAACSLLQQEESQREILEIESTALFSKTGNAKGCGQCGNKGHVKEKCWLVIGYPQWHPKAKKFPQKRDNKVQAYKGKTQGFNDSADHGQNMHLASDTSVPHGAEDAASGQEHSHQQPLTVPSTSVPGTRRLLYNTYAERSANP
ncbi:hypothetical protein Cgig2_017071 [Carnegiea gigantea]|uniref:CCHC-type domain-containing protein n=1 Tax=Carnegiea gigantea TaxID=171969 RepID=A0A9Q1GWT5_9CARY|nr:hypothetical protein Cgig2_017071 [Carnegiea gigantea]